MRKSFTFLLGVIVVTWIGYTVSAVLLYGGAVLFDLSTTSRIMSVRNDELIHSAIGLTYHGVGGALLVFVESILVLASLWFGVRGSGRKKLGAVLVLVAWTTLWFGNAIWLQFRGWSRTLDLWIIATAMFLTLVWAGLRWTESNQGDNSFKDASIR